MLKKYKVVLVIISFFLATTALTLITHESKIPTKAAEQSSEVWAFECETPKQRPESLTLTCADGGMRVEELIWAVWDKNGAVGYGTYLENDCQPSCAEGTYSRTPVYVTISDLTQFKDKNFLRTLEISPDQGRELPRGQAVIQWDLMDFALMMQEVE